MTRTLDEWLAYQDRVNVRSIELGLDRVSAVWQRMGASAPARQVITVGGTNGKGSTVAMLEAMLTASGQRVGCYTRRICCITARACAWRAPMPTMKR
jgi:dihydrofolate synthase/folylpolyglutamate synthase